MMDLVLYQAILTRYWGLFVAVVVLTVGIVWFLSATAPTRYEGSLFLSVAQRSDGPTTPVPGFYQFDEFYSIQGSTFVADYLSGWLRDPATVAAIVEKSSIQLAEPTLRQLSNFYTISALGRTGFEVRLTSAEPDDITSALGAAKDAVLGQLSSVQAEGLYDDVVVRAGEPIVLPEARGLTLNLILSFLGGCILGFVLLLILSLGIREPRRS